MTLHDLKESRQFEKDADMVLLLSRPGPGEKGPTASNWTVHIDELYVREPPGRDSA